MSDYPLRLVHKSVADEKYSLYRSNKCFRICLKVDFCPGPDSRVAESVVTLLRRNETSKDLVSKSLSSKLTCEREMAQKALELLLTAQNAFEREREISSQGS